MKKKYIQLDEVHQLQQSIYSLLYSGNNNLQKIIYEIVQSQSPFLFPDYPLFFVDQSKLFIENAFLSTQNYEYLDIHSVNTRQLLASITSSSAKPLICDIPGQIYKNIIMKMSTRKIIFILNMFSIDQVITRQELFNQKNVKYFPEIKRSSFQHLIQQLNLHPFIYSNSQSCDIYYILHNFYYFGSQSWQFQPKELISLQIIKSFISQTTTKYTEFDNVLLERDLKQLIFRTTKKQKSSFRQIFKHDNLSASLRIQLGDRRSVRTIFQYFPIVTQNLYARTFISEILSFSERQDNVNLNNIELALRVVEPLKEKWPTGTMDLIDIWTGNKQIQYYVPECLQHLNLNDSFDSSSFSCISDQI